MPVMNIKAGTFFFQDLIRQFDLDLSGLTVYTEAASGVYQYTPILAALAGAKKVYAEARNTRYGKAAEIMNDLALVTEEFGVDGVVDIFAYRSLEKLKDSDIVTNSGGIRPFDREMIDSLKDTAVIPLMWETWEFRPSDFDLTRCKEKGIVVLGTNEREKPCDMEFFIRLTALKLLLDSGYDGGAVLVLGNSPIPGRSVVEGLKGNGINVVWVSEDITADLRYDQLSEHWAEHGETYNSIYLAEHHFAGELLGSRGILSFEKIRQVNEGVKISVMCGNINVDELYSSGLQFFPTKIEPFGFITYQPYMLGMRPVLTLYAAGLKVGATMATARAKGMSIKDTVKEALSKSPAMDFEGELSWL